MKTQDGPAETRMMGIVHEALKRDLLRVRRVLSEAPAPQGRPRVALGQHVTWMLEFLHAHRIAPAADVAAEAARTYTATTSGSARVALVEALDDLIEVLVPHLDREVAEAMPVVAASITNREWDAIEQEYNIKPKTTRQLAMEGHWLLEGIDAEGYDVVVHKVPAALRFILLHGFGLAYQRRARARWTPDTSSIGAPAS